MKRGLSVGMGLVLVGGVVTPALAPLGVDSAAAATRAAKPYDFDGDGYADLAVGVPGEDLGRTRDAGAVQVLYGSASGVTDRDQIWHQGRKGVKGAPEKGDSFGKPLTSADFDGDGFADLAIGIPSEGIGGKARVGAVQVLYGSRSGLRAAGDQIWHQGKSGVPGNNEAGDNFGRALVSGDFDSDGFPDLAIGVPGENVGSVSDAGVVVVLRGSGSGLTSRGAQMLKQGRGGLPSKPGRHEEFGATLATGDVNGDKHDDLVVVVESDADFLKPNYVDLDEASSGVHVIMGSPAGLAPRGSQYFSPEALGFARYSYLRKPSLADFDGDGRDDLAAGFSQSSPREFGVVVLHGHADGVREAPLPVADTPGVDTFWPTPRSASPVASDVTGDGHVDLVLGMWPSMAVIPGSRDGLTGTFVESSPGIAVNYLQALPLSGGSRNWLAIGMPYDTDAPGGRVGVLQVTGTGKAGRVTVWDQDSRGIKGSAESGDRFGVLG